MQFSYLRLQNYKCFTTTDVELAAGATVIHGANGSGKSSLLDACFFALYGAESLPAGRTLESIVTKGESETEVELWFDHAGERHQIERSLRVTESQTIHEAALKTPDRTVSGVTAVEEEVESLLRMDAEDFLNCAYVRQGDITRLLMASPAERQRMIDELLQLGKLETYRERMDNARRGVDRVKRDRESRLADLETEIERLEDAELEDQWAAIQQELGEIEAQLDTVAEELDANRTELDAAADELAQYEDQKASLEELRAELEAVTAECEQARERAEALEDRLDAEGESLVDEQARVTQVVEDTRVELDLAIAPDDEPDDVAPAVSTLEEAREAVTGRLDELADELQATREEAQTAASDAHRLQDKAETLAEQADEYDERAAALETEIEADQSRIAELTDRKTELEAEIDAKQSRFDAAEVPDKIEFGDAGDYVSELEDELADRREALQELETQYETVTQRIEHAERLLEEGKCPECGQEVSEAPEVASLEEDRERQATIQAELDDVRDTKAGVETALERARELEAVEAEVEKLQVQRDSVTEQIEGLEADIESAEAELSEVQQDAAAKRASAEDHREDAAAKERERDEFLAAIEEREAEQAALEEEREALDTAVSGIESLKETLRTLQTLRDRRADVTALVDQHEATLEELRTERTELEAAIDDARIEELESTREAAAAAIEELEAEQESLTEREADLHQQLGSIDSKQEELERKRDRAAELEEQVAAVAGVVGECADIEELYGSLRTELRRRNVRQLEQLLNDIFDLVYQNDAYSHIELTDEYELTVIEKSGEALAPGELSGGEKALFNLSLRCAIYQLLAEGISGKAPLPPLILDEPTVHLDDEHINRISDLVERMRHLGVDQTIVVSHQPEIVDTADERIEILQNPSTNRSRVNVESTDLLAGLSD